MPRRSNRKERELIELFFNVVNLYVGYRSPDVDLHVNDYYLSRAHNPVDFLCSVEWAVKRVSSSTEVYREFLRQNLIDPTLIHDEGKIILAKEFERSRLWNDYQPLFYRSRKMMILSEMPQEEEKEEVKLDLFGE